MMTASEEKEKNLSVLFARLDDLCRSASQGNLGSSCFLSPRDLHFAREYLTRSGRSGSFIEWGGYADAERKKIFVLPEYMEGVKEYAALYEYGFEDELAAVEIASSGYRKVSHRDFMGSVLGLGLDRSVIGDIFTVSGEDSGERLEKTRAIVICERRVVAFICTNLCKVGSDSVRCCERELSEINAPERKLAHISDTLASARADCIVASLLSLSRERAKTVVVTGLLEVDYEVCERPDRILTAPCTVTVRGFGKYRINSLSDKTKKGRLRLDADKYV